MAHTIVHCRRCHAELGLTDGQQFIVGACVFTASVPLACRQCGKRRRWVPAAKVPALSVVCIA